MYAFFSCTKTVFVFLMLNVTAELLAYICSVRCPDGSVQVNSCQVFALIRRIGFINWTTALQPDKLRI